MPIDPEALMAWADKPGSGWLYHRVAIEQLLPWVMRDGLIPRAQTGQRGIHLNMPSRDTHVYLSTADDPRKFFAAGMGEGHAHVAVHVSRLDPELLDSDEDKIGAYATAPPSAVLRLPGADSLPWRADGEPAADWAKRHSATIDASAWALHSLAGGSIAYRGRIHAAKLLFSEEAQSRWRRASFGAPIKIVPEAEHPYYIGP
jgi:hypothetical protein